MNISLTDNNSIIEDSNNIIKVISEEGIKIFNNRADAIKNINPAKVYDKVEALTFFAKTFKGDVVIGSEKAINTFNNFLDRWKNNI